MIPITLRELPVAELTPAPYNPRRPLTATARRKLKASLTEFGLVEPLIWNARTGHVVGGHARLSILRELGVQTVTVSVVDLDDAHEKALNIVLNNQEAQGRYDPARLAELLTELDGLRELSGFDLATLRNLRLAPVDPQPKADHETRIELTFVLEPAQFEQLRPRFDELIREFDLVTHLRSHSS